MDETIKQAVLHLAEKIVSSDLSADEAMKYTQAASNLANAGAVLAANQS